MKPFKFGPMHNISTVNAELIKTGHCIIRAPNGNYFLCTKKRGYPHGKQVEGFLTKTAAVKCAEGMINYYYGIGEGNEAN